MSEITIVLLGLMAFCIYMIIRNELVFKLRQRVLHDIHNAKIPFKKTMKMYELYDTVSYYRMMWRIFTSTKKIEKECRERVGLDKKG